MTIFPVRSTNPYFLSSITVRLRQIGLHPDMGRYENSSQFAAALPMVGVLKQNAGFECPAFLHLLWNEGRFNPAIPFSFLPFLQFQCALYWLVLPVGIVITDTHQNSPLRRLF